MRQVEKDRSEAAAMLRVAEGAVVEGREAEREGWYCDHAVVNVGRKKRKQKRKGEVRRTEVLVQRMRGGHGEDRHQPTEAMAHIKNESKLY